MTGRRSWFVARERKPFPPEASVSGRERGCAEPAAAADGGRLIGFWEFPAHCGCGRR